MTKHLEIIIFSGILLKRRKLVIFNFIDYFSYVKRKEFVIIEQNIKRKKK